MSKLALLLATFTVIGCVDQDTGPPTGSVAQALTNSTYTPDVDKSGTPTPLANTESMSAPGGVHIGAVFTGSSTAVGSYSLTDAGKAMATNRYVGYHLIDSSGTRWTISANTATGFTFNYVESLAYPTPATPNAGNYAVYGGAGIYAGPLPTGGDATNVGGICASELGLPCPVGYLRGDHGYFGTGDGNDQDLTVIGCTNLEQLRFLSPYRPEHCNECGTGSNGCTAGVDCAWNTITEVNDYGQPDDFAKMVRTSNLHINPGTGATDQVWTGINDGNDTGRVMLFQNESDLYTPTTINMKQDDAASTAAGDRFLFAYSDFDWKLEPGATAFLLHDDGVDPDGAGAGVAGPDRWRLAGWTSTRWPRVKVQRIDAEEESNSIHNTGTASSSCGSGSPTITKGRFAFTIIPGTNAASCQIDLPADLFTTRPTCTVTPEDMFMGYWQSITWDTTNWDWIRITSNGTPGYYLGVTHVNCVGHEL